MTVVVTPAWIKAIPQTRGLAGYVECWNGGNKVGTLPVLTGSVTDAWVTGLRRTLSMTIPPIPSAKNFLVPGCELRPYYGMRYASGPPELVPLGRFPVTARDIGIKPDSTISLSCQDRWQWIVNSPFVTPRVADVGWTIKTEIAHLIIETGMWPATSVVVTATSNALVAAQTWDSDRNQAIGDLCKTIGAEVFIKRDGTVLIRDRQAVTAPARALYTGTGGALIDMVETLSNADVYNGVRVVGTNTDPAFAIAPVIVQITDHNHPAFAIAGRVPRRIYQLTSAQITDPVQALAAAQKMLTKISRNARSIALTALPDLSIDASDTIRFVWPGGISETAQVQQVVHPMRATDAQTIETCSTRTDEDFNP